VTRVLVVGGGVSGLTVAYRLLRTASAQVTVLEARSEPGGKVRSVEVGGLPLPAGADSFVARKPWAAELCRELGLELEPPGDMGAYLWTVRGLVPYVRDTAFGIPGDVGNVMRWPGLSRAGRRRALQDLVRRKRRGGQDEPLGSLLRRRLGDEATDMAVGPLLAGLYAGDVDRLSVAATFPELAHWEASQGSLVRGAQAALRRGGADPGPMFLRPRRRVEGLTEALRDRVGDRIRTRDPALELRRRAGGWSVRTPSEELVADAVVLAVPAAAAGPLLAPISPAAAAGLQGIPSVSTGVVLMVYAAGTAGALPPGTGFVVPRGRAPMTACTWLSNKWPSEDFGDRAVLRCFVGAAGDEDVVGAEDDELIEACSRHLTALLALPQRPEHAAVVRWPASMPQYEVGHLDRVAGIRASLPNGIFLTGQSFDGVGIADCVHAAGSIASDVAAAVTMRSPTEETV
jgi:protoporphyrinogen/coproporphyrinogen III oxidase